MAALYNHSDVTMDNTILSMENNLNLSSHNSIDT